MKLASECILIKEKDGWTAILPQFNGAATSGGSREEAIGNAKEVLEIEAGDLVREGKPTPPMQHLAEVAVIEVEVSPEDAERMEYVAKTEAAERLGIPTAELSGLISNGKLTTKVFGNDELVSIESINACL